MRPIECNNYHECAVRLAKAALIIFGIPAIFCGCLKLIGDRDGADKWDAIAKDLRPFI